MTGPGEDIELIRQAVEGDMAALKTLLMESRPRLLEYVQRRLPHELAQSVDADDLVQETHIGAFRRINTFQACGDDAFFRWLATIAASRMRDELRRHRTLKRGGGVAKARSSRRIEDSTIALLNNLAGPHRTPSRSFARIEAVDAVHAALAELPEHYRRAVWLVHIEGLPVRDAANEMARTERALHGLCRRGLRLLQRRLQDTDLLTSTD